MYGYSKATSIAMNMDVQNMNSLNNFFYRGGILMMSPTNFSIVKGG